MNESEARPHVHTQRHTHKKKKAKIARPLRAGEVEAAGGTTVRRQGDRRRRRPEREKQKVGKGGSGWENRENAVQWTGTGPAENG